MIDLSRYEFSLLREGDLALYRGCGRNLEPILLVSAEEASVSCFKRLEHEFSLRAELDVAWAARPLELLRYNGRWSLVLEDPGGAPLDRQLVHPLEMQELLSVAISLAAAIRQIHERGLIHKDIKPANILVSGAASKACFTGFGIASRLPRERQTPRPPEVIAGTLAYMAPEQTGRMNRSVDARSDLYALGVTLYQMLTGELPFTANQPMEWIHCHIALQPMRPSRRRAEIPEQLSNIVTKLLAKTAEERYQTAAGIEADLRRCAAEWMAHGKIADFPLAEQDVSNRLLIPERLYGREREIEILLRSFDQVLETGAPGLLLVSGYSGMGKSSVVSELHKVIVPSGSLFASGKFDQYRRDIPYATIGHALQGLVHSLLGESEAVLDQWRDALSNALGSAGQLVVNIVPELELIIGAQPPFPDLSPVDAQSRFQTVFRRFVGVFARQEHPLVLFLDDLQWIDGATLDLIEHLLTSQDVRHLFLIAAYRDNEVGPALLRKLEAIHDAGAQIRRIVLQPLALQDIGRMVTDALRCEPDRAQMLAELVHEKTAGNPFFAIQFLVALHDERLLLFDASASDWTWDMDSIRAKTHTDNVVDLLAEKLKRLSNPTQEALKQLACLGATTDLSTLSRVRGATDVATHAVIWEAVQTGLVTYSDGVFRFVHDRIQQAAYSLLPEERRAALHLRIGRALLAGMTDEEVTEHPFELASQFNRGASLLIDRNEKAQVAGVNLHAGVKAKTSAAYASARAYFSAGMTLLDEADWASHYELAFRLWLERAECEFSTGGFDKAEELIAQSLARATSKSDMAAAYDLLVRLYVVKGEYPRAVQSALACMKLFGIDLPSHPTWSDVVAEYESVSRRLQTRPIETLIDLPLMSDSTLEAVMPALSTLFDAAYLTNLNLFCLHVCRMVNISLTHGMCGASAHGYVLFGFILGPVFHRYDDGFRFAKLACDLTNKHNFLSVKTRIYLEMGMVAPWTQSLTHAIDLKLEAFRSATETGDLTFACYSLSQSIADRLVRNDPLDVVWRECERSMDFVQKTKFRDVAGVIASQQRFIASMQGTTDCLPNSGGALFDEARFESELAGRMPVMNYIYLALKLKSRFLMGRYPEAHEAAGRARELLWAAAAQIHLLDYYLYAALTAAALYDTASEDRRAEWQSLLIKHREQLREWTKNYSPTFNDKHMLVSAEIARIEGRDADAMRLYENAIQSARNQGFLQNEALAHEVAARYYAARGVDSVSRFYLRNARECYLRWGAGAKARQLEELHPHLRDKPVLASATATLGAPVDLVDVGAVVRASQVMSSEIEIGKLVKTLMRIAIEHAGAERGLLIFYSSGTLQIEAEAKVEQADFQFFLRQETAISAELPESLIHTVARVQKCIILDDASAESALSADDYVRRKRLRSVLILPLVKQAELVGILYLENNLATHAFTPDRVSVLELFASQAAISLENARLYNDLREREAKIRRLVDANIIGIIIWDFDGGITEANDTFLRMVGYDRDDLVTGRVRWTDLMPPEWRDRAARALQELKIAGSTPPFEREYFRKDGQRVPVLIGAASLENGNQGVAFVLDLTERKQAEAGARESERRYREVQMELAHANRVATMGQLTASIAHEVNQPIAAIVGNAEATLRWLAHQPPNMEEARMLLGRIVKDGRRMSDVIGRIRDLINKAPPRIERFGINSTISEVIELARGEVTKGGVSIRTFFAEGLPVIQADRTQLQQVILNLIVNAVQALDQNVLEPRELSVGTETDESNTVLVSIRDTGPGIGSDNLGRLFDPFYTTKTGGMGMGLSICRSIIEAHGGRIWVTPNDPRGAIFHFTIPSAVMSL